MRSRGWLPAYAATAGFRRSVALGAAAMAAPGMSPDSSLTTAAGPADRRTRPRAPTPFSPSALDSSGRQIQRRRSCPAPCVLAEKRPPGRDRHRRFGVPRVALSDRLAGVEAPRPAPARAWTAQSQPPVSDQSTGRQRSIAANTTRISAWNRSRCGPRSTKVRRFLCRRRL